MLKMQFPETDTDILVVGCGPAGLLAALKISHMDLKVTCIENQTQEKHRKTIIADNRSTAILMPGIHFLQDLGVWNEIKNYSEPLKKMRIIDAGGESSEIRYLADFNADEINQSQFGYNVPNRFLKEQLVNRIKSNKSSSIEYNKSLSKVVTREKDVVTIFDDGTQISSKLIIAADGRESFLRESQKIRKKKWSYDQKALAFVVSHEFPHENVSIEIHRNKGPFTLVPLPSEGQNYRSAVVWMDQTDVIDRLNSLTLTSFSKELQKRSFNVLGDIEIIGERTSWPIISQYARKLHSERLALIAEAAHVFPPIGAQGLNTSFGDVRSITGIIETCCNAGEDFGLQAYLEKYTNERWSQIYIKLLGIDTLNRAALFENSTLKDLRLRALKTIHKSDQLRNIAIRSGLGY